MGHFWPVGACKGLRQAQTGSSRLPSLLQLLLHFPLSGRPLEF